MVVSRSRRYRNITLDECQEWIDNHGSINPITNARINPNLTSEILLKTRVLQKKSIKYLFKKC